MEQRATGRTCFLENRSDSASLRSFSVSMPAISAKLHCTDTGYEHVVQHHQRTYQRTSSQQFYNLLYNKLTTNGQKFATSQHLDMSRCWALALRCGKFVVQQVIELLSLSVGGVVQHVRSRCPCSGVWH